MMSGIENSVLIGVLISALLGLAAGIGWPYLNAWLSTDGPLPFNFKMVLGRIIGGVLAFLASGAALTQIQALADAVGKYGWIGYGLAFFSVFAGAYGGREAQKTPGAVGAALARRKNGGS
jgi:hypothetical protein